VLDSLPETRGGRRRARDMHAVYLTAKRNPGRWVVALLDDTQGSRTWLMRRYPDVTVSTRTLPHNTAGAVTVFVTVDP